MPLLLDKIFMSTLDRYFKLLAKCTTISSEQERELLTKAKAGDQLAYNKLLTAHLKFVVSIAKQYQNHGLALEELIAEGNLGLVKAFNKFDLERPNNFLTYAVWWIRQSIMNSIHENSKLIRLPVNKITNITKLNRIKHEYEVTYNRPPTAEDLKVHLTKLGLLKLLNDEQFAYNYVPLDAPQTDNNKTLSEVIPDEPTYSEKEAYSISLKQELALILASFPAREQQIIYMYFGIDNVRNYTLEEIGVDLGLTRERIRQIKQKVIEKLQSRRLRKFLQPFLNDDLHN